LLSDDHFYNYFMKNVENLKAISDLNLEHDNKV